LFSDGVGAPKCGDGTSGLVHWHIHDSARLNRGQESFNDWHEPDDKRDLIAGQHEDGKLPPTQILLMPDILVGSYKDIKEFFGST
jgi:hypothetical protein